MMWIKENKPCITKRKKKLNMENSNCYHSQMRRAQISIKHSRPVALSLLWLAKTLLYLSKDYDCRGSPDMVNHLQCWNRKKGLRLSASFRSHRISKKKRRPGKAGQGQARPGRRRRRGKKNFLARLLSNNQSSRLVYRQKRLMMISSTPFWHEPLHQIL